MAPSDGFRPDHDPNDRSYWQRFFIPADWLPRKLHATHTEPALSNASQSARRIDSLVTYHPKAFARPHVSRAALMVARAAWRENGEDENGVMHFTVDGTSVRPARDPSTPLVTVLWDDLDLRGAWLDGDGEGCGA